MNRHPRQNVPSLPSIDTMLQEGPNLPSYVIRQQEEKMKSIHFGHRRHTSDFTDSSACFTPRQQLYEVSPTVTSDTLPPLRLPSPPEAEPASPSSLDTFLHHRHRHQPPAVMVMQPKLRFTTDPCTVAASTAPSPVTFPPAGSCHDPHDTSAATRRRHHHSRSYSDMTYHTQQQSDKNSTNRYFCPYCRKGFSRPSSLRTHTYSHTGEKPFICPVEGCYRRFNVHSNLRRHFRRHQAPVTSSSSSSSSSFSSTITSNLAPSSSPAVTNRPSLFAFGGNRNSSSTEYFVTTAPAPAL